MLVVRERELVDVLVDLLIKTVHRIGARAGRKVTKELTNAFKKVRGKENILFSIAEAAIDHPDDAVRTVVYPAVAGGEKTLKGLVHEYRTKGPEYDRTVRATLKASYSNHYRRGLIDLLEALEFRSNNDTHRPVLDALELVKRHARAGTRYFPIDDEVPIHRGLRGDWKLSVFTTVDGRERVKRPAYEICMFQALRDQLRCKEIWVVGADRGATPTTTCPPTSTNAASTTTGHCPNPWTRPSSLPISVASWSPNSHSSIGSSRNSDGSISPIEADAAPSHSRRWRR